MYVTETLISAFNLIFPHTGTASADQSAKVWSSDSNIAVAHYHGHTGSVNCIEFHSTEPIACTGSGDESVHVWRFPLRTALAKRASPRDDDAGDERRVCCVCVYVCSCVCGETN